MRAWNKVRKHIGKHHESTKTKRKTHTTAILMQWHIFLTRKTTKAYNYKIWGRSIVIQPSEPNLSQHQTNEQLRLLCYIVPRDPKQWDVYEHVGQWPVAHQCTHKGSPISPMLITTIPAPTPHLVTGGNFFQGITKYISTIRKIRKNMQWLSWKIFPCDTHCIILWLLSVKYFNFHKNIPLNISWQSTKYFTKIWKICSDYPGKYFLVTLTASSCDCCQWNISTFIKIFLQIFLDNQQNLKNMQWLIMCHKEIFSRIITDYPGKYFLVTLTASSCDCFQWNILTFIKIFL